MKYSASSGLESLHVVRMLCRVALIGIFIFFIFSIIAMMVYPGGTNVNHSSSGFNIFVNYWCDLYAVKAYNGLANPARTWALVSTFVLATGFVLSWICLPNLFKIMPGKAKTLSGLGASSMAISVFLFTPYHDTVIHIAGFLATVALLASYYLMYRDKYYVLCTLGILSLISCIVTYLVYQTKFLFHSLPVLQKVSLILFIIWMGSIDWMILKKGRQNAQSN